MQIMPEEIEELLEHPHEEENKRGVTFKKTCDVEKKAIYEDKIFQDALKNQNQLIFSKINERFVFFIYKYSKC